MQCECDEIDWCDYHAPVREQRDELLSALKTLADDYDAIIGDGVTDSNAPPVLADARAAIAKAEGK